MKTVGFFKNKCPYCGDKVVFTEGMFGMTVAKCPRCSKRAKDMKALGLTEKQIIKILEGK